MRVYYLVPLASFVVNSAFAQATTKEEPGVKAITHCVNVVHNTHPQEQYMGSYYKHFDAYYNPATGTAENNAKLVGDQDPLFVFNKCMAQQGFPLTYIKS